MSHDSGRRVRAAPRTTWPALLVAAIFIVLWMLYASSLDTAPDPNLSPDGTVAGVMASILGVLGEMVGTSLLAVIVWAILYWTFVYWHNPRAGLPYFLVLLSVVVACFVLFDVVLTAPRRAAQSGVAIVNAYSDAVMTDLHAYQAERRAAGLPLSAETLKSDPGLRRLRIRLVGLRQSLEKFRSADARQLADSRSALRRLSPAVLAEFDAGLGNPKGLSDANWIKEDRTLVALDDLCGFMARVQSHTQVTARGPAFERPADLTEFRAHLATVERLDLEAHPPAPLNGPTPR